MSEFSKSYNITENEESIVKYWNDNKIFEKSISKNKLNKQFIFMDGPPFSSGSPHYGHILVGTVKDTIGRWKTINNFCVERNAGWDTHGLPIEYEIEKKLGIKTKQQVLEYGIGNYNEACRDIVMRCAGEWKSTNNRLGRWVDFDNDYKTMDLEFMSKVWNVFSKIYEKGLIYEGVKIMPYSVACTTPLSNFEATSNYQNVSDRTVIVKFKLKNTNTNTNPNTFILSWTTTPWTLPSHYALCINKNITYVLIEHISENKSERYYVAKTRLEFLCEKLKIDIKTITIISEVTGDKLVNLEYEPLYNFHNQKSYTIIEDDYVTDDSGTGVVHIAPAFGEDDYRVSLKYNLITKELSSLYCHIDDSGMGQNCGEYTGMDIKKITNTILKNLQTDNKSLVIFDYNHSYPFCWRSDTPLIYKAVKCWFLNVESIKDDMIQNNKVVNWTPPDIGRRFHNWLENTHDWCLSRNRYWGTPIPIWKADDGSILVITSKEHLEELTGTKLTDIHRHFVDQLIITKDGKSYKREETVLDCWFESGCVPFASPFVPTNVADFICESSDQVRGWWYSTMVISTVIQNKTPFLSVISTGLVLAEDGKKMSKRLKNYPDPLEVVNEYGADALRYYLIMSGASMASELRFKNNDVKEVLQTVIIPLTNSLSFFEEYYKLYTIKNTFSNIDSDLPFDKWILAKTYDFLSTYSTLLNEYKINPINDLLVKYIDDLNNNYIKFNRDIIKGKDEDDIEGDGSKCHKALNTLQKVLTLLCVYLSPILPFFTENMHTRLNLKKESESVHLSNLNSYDIEKYNINDNDTKMIHNLLMIVNMVRQIRNTNDIQLTKPLKNIIIYASDENRSLLQKVESYIMGEGNIMEIEWKNWEATTYEYKYTINMKAAGSQFKSKRKDFEQFMTTITQENLENLYNGVSLLYETNTIDSNLVTVHQLIPTSQEDGYKISEDLSSKLKIKLNVLLDDTTNELYIAKLIATTFQKLRKLGGFHVYDNLRLVMKTNKYTSIVMKHQEYICKTTRVNIEIIDDITIFSFYKEMIILDEICNMYLIKK